MAAVAHRASHVKYPGLKSRASGARIAHDTGFLQCLREGFTTHPDYSDIIAGLGAPSWYDEYGVPRYAAFHPALCNVYADYAALMEVACQWCGVHLRVASSVDLTQEAGSSPRPCLDAGASQRWANWLLPLRRCSLPP